MDNWDDLRYFLTLARCGSLQSASAELKVDPSTVYRRLRSYEEYLGAHLFDRRQRGRYQLTPAGEALLDQARHVEEAILSVDNSVRGRDLQLRGHIRVATSEDLAVSVLPPHIKTFKSMHPEITIELLTANRYYSLTRNEADIAIRPGTSTTEEQVVQRRICPSHMGLFASDEYLAQYGTPQSENDLTNHHIIEWSEDLARDNFSKQTERLFTNTNRYGSNSLLTIKALAVAGLGIALLPGFLAVDEPCLRAVLSETGVDTGYLWLLHHHEIRHIARLRVFNDFMYEALQTDPRLNNSQLNVST